MVLSNAERQRRFRERLRERATGADIGTQAREAVDAGFAAAWALLVRHADTLSGGPDTFSDLLDYQRHAAADLGGALYGLEMWLDPEWDLAATVTDDERAAIERAVAVYHAAMLKHLPPVEAPAKKTRRSAAKAPNPS